MTQSSVNSTTKKKTARVKTASFVIELPLLTTAEDERLLNDRMLCSSRLHNALLQDGIKIVDAMRLDPAWLAAKTVKDKIKQREAYQAVKDAHQFNSVHFDALVAEHARTAGFYGRIGSHEMQAIAKRVFDALAKWVYAKDGRPRFKGKRRMLHSIEGKNNNGMLRWLPERVLQVERHWQIKVILPELAKDEWLWSAMQFETKYCRIVWRRIGGVKRWFVQLVQRGLAPVKVSLLVKRAEQGSKGGIDLGPSSLAFCTPTAAGLTTLCPEINRPESKIRCLQRHIDRQRRGANPDNFRADGTIRQGGKTWVVSNRQRVCQVNLAELHRTEAAVRRNSHGRLINSLLEKALDWQDDGVSPKALQKRYGKSVGKRAPGMLMSELTRKAERAGGSRMIIDTRNLKTSQYDHATHTFEKKSLSQRWHIFRDGRGSVQRDVYSAFLALHSEGSEHNPARLETAWQALESTLNMAGLCDIKSAREGDADPRETSNSRQSTSSVIPETGGLSAELFSACPADALKGTLVL